jgi:acyl-CoA thioester hydrolase
MAAVTRHKVRVLYADTDLAGVVYHANYLRFFEAARTQAICDAGVELAKLQNEQGIVFTITQCSLTFHHPARYGDELTIEVIPETVGPARLVLFYRVLRPGIEAPAVTGRTTIAAVDLARGKVVRLPAEMRGAFVVDGQ